MLNLFYPMAMVLLSWLLLFLLFSGLGLAVLKAIGQPVANGWLWLDSFWLGWALALAVLQLWHFLFPVNDIILLLFAGVAACFLYLQRSSLQEIIICWRRNKLFLLVFALLVLWISNRAIEMPTAYDTGFRDIQAVMWIDSYKIVPGLSNLFTSLAFNHSVYLYDALLDASIWSGRSYHIATGLLIVVYLAYAIRAALQLYQVRGADGARWSWFFATLTIPYIMFYFVRLGGITHFLTDTPVDLLGFLTIIYLLDFLQEWQPKTSSNQYLIFRLAIVILIGFTVKQTYIVFGLAVTALVFALWLRRGGSNLGWQHFARMMIPLSLTALVLILPWMARGVINSGYPAYPQSIGRVEVDWALPAEHLQNRQQTLATNTRQRGSDPDTVLSSWDWLGPWLEGFSASIFASMLPVLISAVALCAYLLGCWRHRRSQKSADLGLWLLAPLLLTLILWFISFPNIKYVRYLFWSMAALLILITLLLWTSFSWRSRLFFGYGLTALCLAYIVFLLIRHGLLLTPAGPNDGFHAHYLPPIKEYTTDSGLEILVPDSHLPQCWQIPLPCSPHPSAALAARVPGEIQHGFRVAQAKEIDAADE